MKGMQPLTKIVLTGGPCGGKTTALEELTRHFTKEGYNVITVSEVATELILKGITPDKLGREGFQKRVMQWQIEKENIYIKSAEHSDLPTLLICDRGAIDGLAYVSEEMFQRISEELKISREDLFKRYDAVFHLMSTAKDARELYNTINNIARVEDVKTSEELDDKLAELWKQHKYVRIISNSNGFEYKTCKLINEIDAFLNREKDISK